MTGPRVLLVEHERATPAGLITEWLERHDAHIDVVPIDLGAAPDRVANYDLVVSLGSEFSAFDDRIAWIGAELALMRDAARTNVPVLGICFGGQLLARSMGATVYVADEPEIGWYSVTSTYSEVVAPGPWFQWHFDTFTLPAGANMIAHSRVGPQAFIAGRSLGLQFHPEVNVEIMESWVVVYRHELDDNGVDPDELLVRTREVAAAARGVSMSLLDGFYTRIARLDRARA